MKNANRNHTNAKITPAIHRHDQRNQDITTTTTTQKIKFQQSHQRQTERHNSSNEPLKIPFDNSVQQVIQDDRPRNSLSANNQYYGCDFSDLLFNVNDDTQTLILKNAKLRGLIIQASAKLGDMSKKYTEMETEFRIEKAGILDDLDKISENYKTYAESHKNLSLLETEYKTLQRDYTHNYNVIIAYQEALRLFLTDYMNLFKLLGSFLNSHNLAGALQFISDVKDLVLENLYKYKSTVDVLNFSDIFDEYTQLLNANHLKQQKVSYEKEPQKQTIPKHTPKTNRQPSPTVSRRGNNISPAKSKSPAKTRETAKCLQRTTSFEDKFHKKTKEIENIESNLKNFFDQTNHKEEGSTGPQRSSSNKDAIIYSSIHSNKCIKEFSFDNRLLNTRKAATTKSQSMGEGKEEQNVENQIECTDSAREKDNIQLEGTPLFKQSK